MASSEQSELERVREQRDQALRFLSHDMRTPVASILALAEQLSRALQGEPAQLQKVTRLTSHGQELVRLMDGFGMQSRALNETLQLAQRLVDDLIEEAVAQAQGPASKRSMRLVVTDNSGAYFFVQVATQLAVRALFNMLMRAVQAGAPGTSIHVLTRLAGIQAAPAVEIEVAYQRAADFEADNTVGDGLGWGLDLTETVATRHGGRFDHDSLQPAQSRLILSLPCLVDTGSEDLA